MNDIIYDIYTKLCNSPSDINEHLPILNDYAKKSSSILELGVRNIVSTYAFLEASPNILHSCDIALPPKENMDNLIKNINKSSITTKYEFILGDDLKIIPKQKYDLIFIDTWHVYDQMKKELEIYSDYSNKYLIFHDIVTYGIQGETIGYRGIYPAIIEFLHKNSIWTIDKELYNNNGLLIIKKDI